VPTTPILACTYTHAAAWNINNWSGVYDRRSPRSLSATRRTRRGELPARSRRSGTPCCSSKHDPKLFKSTGTQWQMAEILLIIAHNAWNRVSCLNSSSDLLQASSQSFNLFLLPSNGRPLLLNFVMFLGALSRLSPTKETLSTSHRP
jgi:hypothetical protein